MGTPGPNIFVLATGKTGSTFIFYSLKESVEKVYGPYRALFEPKTEKEIVAGLAHPCIAKMLMARFLRCKNVGFTAKFEKRTAIIRDPRDTVISRMLYQPRDFIHAANSDKAALVIDVLKAKEAEPGHMGVRQIYRQIAEILGAPKFTAENAAKAAVSPIELDEQFFFFIRYEDIVDGDWSKLEQHVGFPVRPAEAALQNRVKRSATYGDWRKWFTPADVEFFRPFMDPFLKKAGYPVDWELDRAPALDGVSGSGYLHRLFEHKLRTRPLR